MGPRVSKQGEIDEWVRSVIGCRSRMSTMRNCNSIFKMVSVDFVFRSRASSMSLRFFFDRFNVSFVIRWFSMSSSKWVSFFSRRKQCSWTTQSLSDRISSRTQARIMLIIASWKRPLPICSRWPISSMNTNVARRLVRVCVQIESIERIYLTSSHTPLWTAAEGKSQGRRDKRTTSRNRGNFSEEKRKRERGEKMFEHFLHNRLHRFDFIRSHASTFDLIFFRSHSLVLRWQCPWREEHVLYWFKVEAMPMSPTMTWNRITSVSFDVRHRCRPYRVDRRWFDDESKYDLHQQCLLIELLV